MSKYKAFLFDYDGTVVDSNILILHSWQCVADKYIPGRHFDVEYLIKGFGRPLYDCMVETLRDYGIDADVDEAVDVYRSYQASHPEEYAELYPGIKEFLIGIKEKNLKAGIVTSRNTKSLIAGLKMLGVYEYFDELVTCDDTTIHKPDPTPALICCKKLGVDPSDAIMLGDSVHDIACGNNAGSDSAFVKWSFCTKIEDFPEDNKPTYYIEEGKDLLKLL